MYRINMMFHETRQFDEDEIEIGEEGDEIGNGDGLVLKGTSGSVRRGKDSSDDCGDPVEVAGDSGVDAGVPGPSAAGAV